MLCNSLPTDTRTNSSCLVARVYLPIFLSVGSGPAEANFSWLGEEEWRAVKFIMHDDDVISTQLATGSASWRRGSRSIASKCTPPCMHVRSKSKGTTKQGRQVLILVGPADAGPVGPVSPPLWIYSFHELYQACYYIV